MCSNDNDHVRPRHMGYEEIERHRFDYWYCAECMETWTVMICRGHSR